MYIVNGNAMDMSECQKLDINIWKLFIHVVTFAILSAYFQLSRFVFLTEI